MGKKALELNSPSDGKSMGSAKKKNSTPLTKGRPRKSMMRQHRRQSLEAESPEQPHSPQAESPLLKPDEENTQQTASRSKGDKPSRRALTALQWPKRGKGDNNNANADVHQNGPRRTTTARRSSIMSWRTRDSTASIVEEAPRPLSCQPSSCFIGSLNGTTNEMHLPLLTKQTKARLNALKAVSKQRQLEVTIERSDELPFGAYSHPQVRVHIVDRCTGRAFCPAQMTKEAKFCVASDKNFSCTNTFEWQQTLDISVDIPTLLSPQTVLLFEILETKLSSKGTRFRRGKQFESVSTHDDDDEYHHSPGTSSASEYRRIAWGFFHAITNKGTPTMNSFVLPHVADPNESEAMKKPSIVDVCGLRVRLFQYQVVTWMDSYQAKLQWGWRKNHPTVPAVFLQYQKRSRVPAPSTLHIQLKSASPLASPRQTGIPEAQETTDIAANNELESNDASIEPESGGGDNQEPPADALPPDARETESKIASNVASGTPSDVFDLIAPCKRNPSEPCLIPQRVLCSLPTGKRGCSAVSFSPCGRYLAASVSPELGEFVIRVYQMASAELFAVGRGHRGVIYSLNWTTTSTGQTRILSASSDGTVRLWEVRTNVSSPQGSPRVSAFRYPRLLSLVFQWHHFPCFVYCAIFLPGSNGDIVLTGASDGCMRFRKESLVPNGQSEYGSVHVSSVAVNTLCVDSKSGRVFCGNAKGDITVWSRVSSATSFYEYTLIKTIHTGQTSITSLQLHPRKAHLLVHTQPNAIFQYELRSYLLLNKSYAGVTCESLLVKSTFSPDGKLVISGSEDGVPRLFASIHGQPLQRGVWGTHFFHGCPVLDVSWSPTAHVAALCSYGGDNPIVVLCSYRDDKDAVFIDESTTTSISSATSSIQQLTVDAFRAGNQQDVLTGDHAQRLQRALERRRQRLQSKVDQLSTIGMPPVSDQNEHHHSKHASEAHLSRSQLELLTLTTLFRATGGRFRNDRGRATTWKQQTGWDKILDVAASLENGVSPIPKTTTMQSYFAAVFGVKWERNHVVTIDLTGNGLTGPFPAEIARLRFLTTLKMRDNPSLRGSLPLEIYTMPHLKYCYVDGTRIENALPHNIAHSLQITQLKADLEKRVGSAISTVRFCTGDDRTGNLIHWMADMTETEMFMVHSALKKLHENAGQVAGRSQIKCTASNATGPERAAAATKLQRIYRARIERTKFRNFLHSLVEMRVDAATGHTYYVNSRTGEATWEKPKFLGSADDSIQVSVHPDSSGNNTQNPESNWKPYDDGNGNTYYWNSATGESSWEPPAFLSRIYEELRERYGTDKTDEERFELFFQDIDRDGTGEIDQDEFARLCGDLGMALSVRQIKEVFRELDTSGDGQLDRREIIAWLTRNYK